MILVRGERNQSPATIITISPAKLKFKPSHIVRAAVSTDCKTADHILRWVALACATSQGRQHAACASFPRLTASSSRMLQNMPTIYSQILHSTSTTRFSRCNTLAEDIGQNEDPLFDPPIFGFRSRKEYTTGTNSESIILFSLSNQ